MNGLGSFCQGHLTDVCEGTTGFFEILWISFTEMYQVNKLLAFKVPMCNLKSFPFIHYMTVHLLGSHTTTPSQYQTEAIPFPTQECVEIEWNINVQLILHLN